ncbi:MAG: hypothetical protein C0402_10105 [Thermodesulfovibrio sp.]|nr:hypothetical protein [Thermodesulfovibrio sp.]
MITKIFQLIVVGLVTFLFSWQCWWFYPLMPIPLFFIGGTIAGTILSDHKFCSALIVLLPDVIFLGFLAVDKFIETSNFSDLNFDIFLKMLIPTVTAALLGSILGQRIWDYCKSKMANKYK